jgi:dihydropyrimidinase
MRLRPREVKSTNAEEAPEMFDLLVTNGTLVTADNVFSADLGIRNGKIAEVSDPGTLRGAEETIDANFGHRVKLENGWVEALDDFATGTSFAAAGGTTTVIDFAVQRENDVHEAVEARRSETEPNSVVDFSVHAVLTDTSARTIDRLSSLVEAGFPTFKLYMLYKAQGRMGGA